MFAFFVRQKLAENISYFKHPFLGQTNTKWPQTTNIACFHCCETFDNQPYPSVRRLDEATNQYYVYGVFCSLNCVKAYCIEHEPALSTLRLLYFTHMCRHVYNIHDSIKPAPPRIRLQKFGGDLTIEQFRAQFHNTSIQHVLEPPFLQSSLLIEDVPQSRAGPNAYDILDQKDTTPLFDAFLEEKGSIPPPPVEPPVARVAKKPRTEPRKRQKMRKPVSLKKPRPAPKPTIKPTMLPLPIKRIGV